MTDPRHHKQPRSGRYIWPKHSASVNHWGRGYLKPNDWSYSASVRPQEPAQATRSTQEAPAEVT